jgi:hypothetical protein
MTTARTHTHDIEQSRKEKCIILQQTQSAHLRVVQQSTINDEWLDDVGEGEQDQVATVVLIPVGGQNERVHDQHAAHQNRAVPAVRDHSRPSLQALQGRQPEHHVEDEHRAHAQFERHVHLQVERQPAAQQRPEQPKGQALNHGLQQTPR